MISRSFVCFFVVLATVFCGASIARADSFSGILKSTSPTFQRPFVPMSQGSPCILSNTGTAVHYVTFQFTLAATSNVTISFLSSDGATVSPSGADPMLILYGPGGFDPAHGCTNAIVANDDADATTTFFPKIVTTSPLAAGTYTIVVTTFDNDPVSSGADPLPYVFNGFLSVPIGPAQHVLDFDGDGKTDFSVIRNVGGGSSGQFRWYTATNATNVISARDFGIATDFQTPVDFDGDKKTDIAVWRAGTAGNSYFYILQSKTNTVRIVNFGQEGDDSSVVGDYDGDGIADPAVYRAGASSGAQSTWFYLGSLNNPNHNITYVHWGLNGDLPAPGDYDGDGKNDFCINRNGGTQAVFWLRTAAGATTVTRFGLPTDFIVPGDYDGDGKTDIATYRGVGANIQWQWLASSTGLINYRKFGLIASDLTVQGDYDGDGITDLAIWRPGFPSVFWILQSKTNSVRTYGLGTGSGDDIPTGNYNTR